MTASPSPASWKKHRRHFCALAATAGFGGWPARAQVTASRTAGRELKVGGTGSGLVPLQKALEGQGQLQWIPNLSTGGGIKALAAGAIDLALSGRPLSAAEQAQGLVARPLLRIPFVFAVHAEVPQRGVSVDELASMYAGRRSQWAHGVPVRLVLRPQTDGDTAFLRTLGPAMAEAVGLAYARPGHQVAMFDVDVTEALDRVPGSIGLTTLGLLRAERRRAQALVLDGQKPELEALTGGRYPHAKTVHVVTRGQAGADQQALVALVHQKSVTQALAALGCQVVDPA